MLYGRVFGLLSSKTSSNLGCRRVGQSSHVGVGGLRFASSGCLGHKGGPSFHLVVRNAWLGCSLFDNGMLCLVGDAAYVLYNRKSWSVVMVFVGKAVQNAPNWFETKALLTWLQISAHG